MTPTQAFAGERVAITGASGFIASHLAHRLAEVPCTLVRLTRSPESLPPLKGPADVVDRAYDPEDPEDWDEIVRRADTVLHLAANEDVSQAQQAPIENWRANTLPLLEILEAARRQGNNLGVVYTGTTNQRGPPDTVPVDETHPDEPRDNYSLHKLMAEAYLERYVRTGTVRGASLRLTNVCGAPSPGSDARGGVLHTVAEQALDGEDLTVYGTSPRLRDFLYIDDVVDAILRAAAKPEQLKRGHYVLGSGQAITLGQAFEAVAEAAEELTGDPVDVAREPPQGPRADLRERHFVANPRAFHEDTGWLPIVRPQVGIPRMVQAIHRGETTGRSSSQPLRAGTE